MTPRRAEPSRDNAALCDLARRCPQGRRLRFYHDRSDYWERCRLQSDAEVLVLEDGGRVVGAVSVARKTLELNGSPEPAAYVFDLMVDPECRGRGLARQLLRAARARCPQACLFYSYILADNSPSRRLFEAEGFTSFRQPLLYHALLPRLSRRRPPAGFRFLEPIPPSLAAALDTGLRRRYEFLDSTAGHDALFLFEESGKRVWAALRRHEPQVLVELPWYARLVPLLPRPGRPVHAWTLHHVGGDDSVSASAFRRLLGAVAWVADRAGIDAVAVPLFADDPIAPSVASSMLTGWGVPPGRTCLYLGGDRAAGVGSASRPLLLNGQDG